MGHRSNKAYAEKMAGLARPAERWPRWVVTGGGVGYLRPAPGSWGTAVPALMYWAGVACGVRMGWVWGGLLVFGLVASVALVRWGKWGCAYFGEIDPGQVILDEYAGFAVACALVPVPATCVGSWWHAWILTAGIYVLFRLTDTLKLPPANWLERLPWGWGILLDDIAAGVQANILAQVLVRVIPV